ncbi:general secretion pathway protein GspK [Omnitrophica bacterium]|nr:general secretion pathway protein GspK [Candidatus Omnitrophota bacterium]
MMRQGFLSLQRRSACRWAADKKGGILILSLWSICLLTTFAVVLSYGVRQKLTLVKRLDDRDKLRFIADAGVKKAIIELKTITGSDDDLDSNWTMAMSAFKEITVGDGKARYAIIDEERKINIKTAKRPTLQRLFQIVLNLDEMESQKIAASIIDWRDEDSMLTIPLGSAEDSDYRSLRYPYEAKDAEFELIDELLLVKGVTADIFEQIKDYVTIYGEGKVNVNTASKEILLTLGLENSVANMICLYRRGEDGMKGTEDDNIFSGKSVIAPRLSQFYNLSDSELTNLSQIVSKHLDTDSQNFTIKSIATLSNRKISTEVNCVIGKDGKILHWHES